METLDFSTPHNAYHSTRVLCDQMGLSLEHCVEVDGVMYQPKDIICACIYQESGFDNDAKCYNKNSKGIVTSVDVGVVQINSFYHCGKRKDFPSTDYVIANPQKAVKWMIKCYQEGQLKMWVSFSSGAYKHWLKDNSPMWNLG